MKAPWVVVSDQPWEVIMGFLKMDQAYTVPRQSCMITAAMTIRQRLFPGLFILSLPHTMDFQAIRVSIVSKEYPVKVNVVVSPVSGFDFSVNTKSAFIGSG
jgi:hypothetical protein